MTILLNKETQDYWSFNLLEGNILSFGFNNTARNMRDVLDYRVVWNEGFIPCIITKETGGILKFYYWEHKWQVKIFHDFTHIKDFVAVIKENQCHIVATHAAKILHLNCNEQTWTTAELPFNSNGVELLSFLKPAAQDLLRLLTLAHDELVSWNYNLKNNCWSLGQGLISLDKTIYKKIWVTDDKWHLVTAAEKDERVELNYLLFTDDKLLRKSLIVVSKTFPFAQAPLLLVEDNLLLLVGSKNRRLVLFISADAGSSWKGFFTKQLPLTFDFEEVKYWSGNLSPYLALKKINGIELTTSATVHMSDLLQLLQDLPGLNNFFKHD
ncbi:MAG: hypothetical protein MI748_20390 [Opitutales bacterium]|nr:hypothetical protein [Opitutales bacterium]